VQAVSYSSRKKKASRIEMRLGFARSVSSPADFVIEVDSREGLAWNRVAEPFPADSDKEHGVRTQRLVRGKLVSKPCERRLQRLLPIRQPALVGIS